MSERRVPDDQRQRFTPTAERFFSFVDQRPEEEGGCWLWTGALDKGGRPTSTIPRSVAGSSAHCGAIRAARYWTAGHISNGRVEIHRRMCPSTLCVRPEHYELRPVGVKPQCRVPECEESAHAHGLCQFHNDRRAAGIPLQAPKRTYRPVTRERFWSEVAWQVGPDECWEWQGTLNHNGYGRVNLPASVDPYSRSAHRASWYWTHGRLVAPGMQLDHLCHNPKCVNPKHLEEVTPHENVMRSTTVSVAYSLRTHCDNGHPFSGDNLAIRRDGTRKCRQCHRDYVREWNRKRNRKRQGLTS